MFEGTENDAEVTDDKGKKLEFKAGKKTLKVHKKHFIITNQGDCTSTFSSDE